MENTKSENKVANAAAIAALRAHWFKLLESLYQSITENSELECATRCDARCCPRSRSPKNDAVGHVAIMLPFEMEYILSKVQLSPEQFQCEGIELAAGIYVDIAYSTATVPCPFLTEDNKCGIYDIRPLDCRSFPLIPIFNEDETLTFRVEGDCPSVITFSSSYQLQLKKIWQELLPELPMGYRMLFNRL